jgi:hypothetical protein
MIIYQTEEEWQDFNQKMSNLLGISYEEIPYEKTEIIPSEKSFLSAKYGIGVPKPGTSKALIGNTHRKGKKFSEESRKRVSLARMGNKNRLGIPHSDEIKKIISERTSAALKGVPKKVVECPYCGKSGGEGNMKRYHFNNCKFTQLQILS